MTLIEAREALEPRILSNKRNPLPPAPPETTPTFPVDESGSDDEFLIANEGYPSEDNEENNNYRSADFFSLPTLGLNYFNNLNLSLNLNLNLRNTPLWRIYENTSFPKPGGFLSTYLGKHDSVEGDEGLDTINEHDVITPDSRGYFAITSFLRRHGFPSFEDEDCYSEEAILERVRFKKLQLQQQQQAVNNRNRKLASEDRQNFIFEVTQEEEVEKDKTYIWREEKGVGGEGGGGVLYGGERVEFTTEEIEEVEVIQKKEPEVLACDATKITAEVVVEEEMKKNCGVYQHPKVLNPFYNRVEVGWWDKVKIAVLTCTVLPLKIVMMALILLVALFLAVVGLYGVSFEESQYRPLAKWRRGIRWLLANVVMRMFIFFSGFVWSIKETGKRAAPEEAPIFVVGPHSSYFDAFAVILLGAPSVVAKLSTKDIPVFGRLVTLTQAVYVSRESKGSRRQTMEVLKQRAQDVYHGSGMPQIFIFPEGTCSNRSSLIRFKQGAFVPQVPVQPVLIRYPNKLDACTWTFDGPPAGRNIWHALSQLYNKIEIEYLPVYKPNEAEKQDSALFADNVRKVMAKALNVPMSDYQFEDGTLLCNMRENKLVQKFRSIHRAKRALGLWGSSKECFTILEGTQLRATSNYYKMGFYEFQREFFHVSSEDTTVPEVQAAFNCFKKENKKEEDGGGEDADETVDIRPYLVFACMMYEDKTLGVEEIPRKVCQMYGLNDPEVTPEAMKVFLEELFLVSTDSEKKGGNKTSQPQSQCSIAGSNVHTSNTNETEQRISRILDFAKLFAAEVTERLPKTYPSREERDKKPTKPSSSSPLTEKLKSD